MHNVTTIKRHQKQPFPDFWPKIGYNAVVYALFRNQPMETAPAQNYFFALKTDLSAPVFSVIVQPNKSVLYQTANKDKALGEGFTRWFNLNLGSLRRLADTGFRGTLVGKMSQLGDRDLFCLYYIVQEGDVLVDARTMEAVLGLKDNDFDGTIVSIPVAKIATVNIDKVEGSIRSSDLLHGLSGAMIGIPAVRVEARTAEDGTESTAPPKVLSNVIHMRYMGFVQTFDKA